MKRIDINSIFAWLFITLFAVWAPISVINYKKDPPVKLARYTIQFKLVDGSWTDNQAFLLDENSKFEILMSRGSYYFQSFDTNPYDDIGFISKAAVIDYKMISKVGVEN